MLGIYAVVVIVAEYFFCDDVIEKVAGYPVTHWMPKEEAEKALAQIREQILLYESIDAAKKALVHSIPAEDMKAPFSINLVEINEVLEIDGLRYEVQRLPNLELVPTILRQQEEAEREKWDEYEYLEQMYS